MASYYYLMASLPMLSSGGGMPMSYEDFLTCCRGNVDEETYGRLESLTLSSSEGPLLEEWSAAYGSLMRELNAQRSLALGKPYPQGAEKDGLNAHLAAQVMNAKNPLEAEQILLDSEFELLDDLVGLHMFDSSELFGYALKLKLLERRSCFEKEKGKAEFGHLFEEIRQRVFSL